MMMFHLHVLCALAFIATTTGFFLSPPSAVLPAEPISCYVGLYVNIEGLYATLQNPVGIATQASTRLCAIREDIGINNGSKHLRRTYIASNITNILRQMVHSRCQGFSNDSDLGYGSCTPRPFELYNTTTVCICASDFCNRDFQTCQQSIADSNPSPPLAPQVVPVLTTPIHCYDNTQTNGYPFNTQTNLNRICIPRYVWSSGYSYTIYSKLIDYGMCNSYVQANTVLCRASVSPSSNNYYYNYGNYGESWQEYWSGTRLVGYTTEDYTEDIMTLLTDSTPAPDSLYFYYNTEIIFNYEIFEGSTNVVVRRSFYDMVGNRLGQGGLHCFCSTNNCNVDFDTCATGINYNTTAPTATVPTRTVTSPTGPTATMTTSRTTRTTRTTATSTLPTIQSPPMAFFPFDGNALDVFGNYNGSLIGGATFTNNGYIRRALLLARTTQYVQTNFINLAHQSFTISGWISTTTVQNTTVFSECPAPAARKCLRLGIMNQHLSMDFSGGFSTTGTTAVSQSRWVHVAFVYDETAEQQLIYLDGVEDGRSTAGTIPHYLGTCQSVRIGANFIGSIDHLVIVDRAKSPNEILAEATLVASYSFEGNLSDSSSNGLHGAGTVNFNSNGHSGQALSFSNNGALFQTIGLTVFTIPNQSFSISLWLKPAPNVSQNNFLTLSSTNWCVPLLGFSSSGKLLFKYNGVATSAGMLPTSVWTHIVYSYSPMNGAQLYINGAVVQNMQFVFTPSSSAVTLNAGTQTSSSSACGASAGRYEGLFDELKVYSRELSSNDANDLANS